MYFFFFPKITFFIDVRGCSQICIDFRFATRGDNYGHFDTKPIVGAAELETRKEPKNLRTK